MITKFVQRSPSVKKILSGLVVIILVHSGCRHDTITTPLKITGYRNNPILSPGDSLLVTNPYLLLLDTICLLYYDHGFPQGTIAVATARVH